MLGPRASVVVRWDGYYQFTWVWVATNGFGLRESGEATSARRADRSARKSLRRMGNIKQDDVK